MNNVKLGTLLLKRKRSSDSPPASIQPQLRIAYRIVRPSLLNSDHSPLVLIHGGPSLASEYLNPIVDEALLKNRSIILYDQLGCGWSSAPSQNDFYGVKNMALDLRELLWHFHECHNMKQYHLLGHSLGGAIGYELIKLNTSLNKNTEKMPTCLSFILSNASTNFKLSENERRRLYDQIRKQQNSSSDIAEDHYDIFFSRHICRNKQVPNVLQMALTRQGKEWSANTYVATPVDADKTKEFPRVLIIRGEHDFVTEKCTIGWSDLIGKALLEVVLSGCAHYPHLECPNQYTEEIQRFCNSNE